MHTCNTYIHTHTHTYRCHNTEGSFTCSCNAGYYTIEEHEQAANCSLLVYEPEPSGVRVLFQSAGLGTFCIDVGMYICIYKCISMYIKFKGSSIQSDN